MLQFPIHIPRQSYRGQSKSLARLIERWNFDAAALEAHGNTLALEQIDDEVRYSFEQIAKETGYDLRRVRELYLAAGCAGHALSIARPKPEDAQEYLEELTAEAQGGSGLTLEAMIAHHAERPLRKGDRVAHPSYGEGTVALLLAEATVACVDWDDMTVAELRMFTSQLKRVETGPIPTAASAACPG
ncbi:hypothetical protein [Rhodovulum visakhapatnamense]|uniref:Uncharacterized protein n=1 Tax=Rhodovulum visakhapatnamense TaxID=364297 RepID=A0A4R8F627_9RHOB|nr:hypothetical protein [Rhodovulum visakhapatnamense]TDX20736.1 hypothetical protein EV657_1533 [Rhodovulum visakhapatnamense]